MAIQHIERIAILGATAVFILLELFPALLPSHRALFVLFFLYLVLAPGWLLSLRIAPDARGVLRAAHSFVCGTALAFAALFVIALAHADIRLLGAVMPALVAALALWKRPPREAAASGPRGGRTTPLLLALLIVIVAALILGTGDPLFYMSDPPDHIAYIRTISNTHQAFPERFYYPESGALTRDIRKGMIHALWGAVNSLTGSPDVAAVWPLIAVIGSVFLLVSLYAAGLMLFGSAAAGLVAAALYVLCYGGGLAGHQLLANASGYAFGRSFYVLAFAAVPLYLHSRRTDALAFVALALFAATGTHIAHLAAALFIIAVFSLSHLAAVRGERRALLGRGIPLLFAAAIVPNVPYLLMRYLRDYAPNNPIHTHVQGALFFTDRFYVMNPIVFFETAGPLGALALLSVFILWKRGSTWSELRFLLVGVIAVYLLLFVPLWYPFLSGTLSYLLLRFEFAVPSMLVCAMLLGELWKALRGHNPELGRARAACGAAAAVVLLAVPLAGNVSGFAYGRADADANRLGSYRNLDDLFEFINLHCPRGIVIASDPITSFGIPAFTDAFVICPYDQHSTPNDSTAIKRIVDARRIFSPASSLADVREILVEYGAEYLVVNGRIPPGAETMYWKPDRAIADTLAARIRGAASPFGVIFERDGVVMARLVAGPAGAPAEAPRPALPFIGDSIDAAAASRLTPSGIEGVFIERVRASGGEVARGDTIVIDVSWVAAERCPPRSYVAYLRFDTEFPKNALYRLAWSKPYRKLIERTTGHRFRFRADFQPLGGVFPPDTWPALRAVHDRVRVPIPANVAPGAYTISLKLAEKPQYPNYVLGDILTDDDSYGGAVTAAIQVR